MIDNAGTGIFSDRAGGNTIQGNNIEGNGDDGVRIIAGGGGETVRGNNVSNNDDRGIFIWRSPNSLVRGNTVNGNDFGIVLNRNVGSRLQGNTALGNTVVDLSDNNDNIVAVGTCVNTWKSNTFVTEDDPGNPPTGCIQ